MTIVAVPHISWNPSEQAQKIGLFSVFGIVIACFRVHRRTVRVPEKARRHGGACVGARPDLLAPRRSAVDGLSLIPPLLNFIIDGANALVDRSSRSASAADPSS